MQWFNKHAAIIILLVISAITAFLFSGATKSRFDYDLEKFFPASNTETKFYQQYRSDFENDYDFLFIGLYSSNGIYDTTFLQKLEKLTDTLKRLKDVTEVTSITNLRIPLFISGGISFRKYVHLHNDSLLCVDSIRLNQTNELSGSFISTDQKTAAIFLHTKDQMAKVPSDTLLKKIEILVSSANFEQFHLAGKIKAQQVYLSRMEKEILLFLTCAAVMVIIFLAITFRSISNVIVPLVVVLLSITWQVGIMYFLGKKIDVLLTLLPTILFIVGMSDVIHILSKYMEELRGGLPKRNAIVKTLKDVGLATFITSFTTAIGFFTLITSNVSPIKEFGIYTSLGVIIAYFLAITMLPSILLLMPTPKLVSNKKYNVYWDKFLTRQLRWIFSHRKIILIGSFIFTIVSCVGVYNLKINNLLLEDLREKEPLKKEFNFFEKNFSGARPFEMYVEAKNSNNLSPGKQGNILSYETIKELEKLENIAVEKFQLGFVRSPLWVLKMFNRSFNSGLNTYYRLPQNEKEHELLLTKINQYGGLNSPEMRKLISVDLKKGRITGKMYDLGSYKVNNMEKDFVKSLPPLNEINYRLTGSARLIDKNISQLSINLMQSLGISILIIAFIFGLMYRSFKMMIIALIPNLIPMIFIAGVMGFIGIDIKMSTSLIFSIAFGIAVDDTIHFISRFKIEQMKGSSTIYAIKRSFLSTGRAMILTSVILCAGFVTMITSSFMSIFYLGFLLSLTLFIALLADLYLLPVLLLPGRNKSSKNKT